MALPLATIAVLGLSARESVWPDLIRTVLPGALIDTGLLVTGVGTVSLLFGSGTAWLVTIYRFQGRAVLDRMLVLPVAMPSYILAYCYVELLDPLLRPCGLARYGGGGRVLRAAICWLHPAVRRARRTGRQPFERCAGGRLLARGPQ